MALNMRPSGLVLEKKQILAWYDTTPVYICLVLLAMGTAIFSLVGISVALDVPEYRKYVWAPKLLLAMSAVSTFISGVRLIKRMVEKFRERG